MSLAKEEKTPSVAKDSSSEKKNPHKDDDEEDEEKDNISRMYGKSLRAPILGKHFQLPGRSAVEQRIDLDITASYIPVFTHLKIHEANELTRPSTPPSIRRVATENYMEFYEPKSRGDRDFQGGATDRRESLRDADPLKSRRRSLGVKPTVAFGPNEERGVEWNEM